MKTLVMFIILGLSSLAVAQTADEADIPPPPMPDYMVESGYEAPQAERNIDSEPQPEDGFNNQSASDIKQEFLQAGDDDTEVEEPVAVQQEVIEGDYENPAEEPVIGDTQMVLEETGEPVQVQAVNEVEVAEPEFEQAEMGDTQSVAEQYQQDAGNEIQQEAASTEEPVESKLAAVEETLEEREEVAEQTLAEGRQPSNKKKFKAGMYKFKNECRMYAEARTASDEAGVIRPGRKLWIDPHTDGWHKAYKKSGTVYIPTECLDQ